MASYCSILISIDNNILIHIEIRNAGVGGSSPLGGTILNQINEFALKPSQTGLTMVLAIFTDFSYLVVLYE